MTDTPLAPQSAPPENWKPTRKWYALVVTGIATILASLIDSGSFDATERGMTATLLVGAAAAYFKKNPATPGGAE